MNLKSFSVCSWQFLKYCSFQIWTNALIYTSSALCETLKRTKISAVTQMWQWHFCVCLNSLIWMQWSSQWLQSS